MKKFISALVVILLLASFTICLEAKTITIKNSSGAPLHVYNFNFNSPVAVPITGSNYYKIDGSSPTEVTLSTNSGMRLYFSKDRLAKSIEIGVAPSPFYYPNDAIVSYSFMEYSGVNLPTTYTVDLSYIDEYSYPVTLTFSNVGNYKKSVEGHEYGIKKISKVKTELKSKTDYSWGALIWPKDVGNIWNHDKYPTGMVRIIGPNRVWKQLPGSSVPAQSWVPATYQPFITSLPKTGTQLFSPSTNWTGWEIWKYDHDPSPSDTGYVKALHAASNGSTSYHDIVTGKTYDVYGFFCYPHDNASGGFQLIPNSVDCTVTVYSLTDPAKMVYPNEGDL